MNLQLSQYFFLCFFSLNKMTKCIVKYWSSHNFLILPQAKNDELSFFLIDLFSYKSQFLNIETII